MNRLGKEKSPYLLQHAQNPVDWYPWGEEAFQAAKEEDKPILLSIGYATCHWCHVMEHETFSDPEIAKLMNEAFINVKVDREERPDIDSIYMEFAQALMSSAGGWPLNVLLTPDLKPFFAVTYLPPKTSKGLIGMPQFVENIQQIWSSEERSLLLEQAEKLTELFAHTSNATGQELPSEEEVVNAVEKFFEVADPAYGGIRGEPKFPLGYQSEFLLAFGKLKSDSRAIFYVELTLAMMYHGGIYDHLGGGFSRYAVDEKWMIPHFEKMLYDNAILAHAYLAAWKFTKKELYAKVARETLNYILREMTDPEGGFYSGQDADVNGQEGLYYTWTPAEVQGVLPGETGELFCQYYGVSPSGNFNGRNVLNIEIPLEEFAQAIGVPANEFADSMDKACATLLQKRETRIRPFKDDKILTSWNGLMIDALARAGSALKEPRFTQAALKAANFIKNNLWVEGRLLHRWRQNEAKHSGCIEDYAYLLKGVLSLYEEGHGAEWLDWAISLAKVMEKEFEEIEGAFYQTDGKEPLILRKCEFYDGAEPSGNGVHTENLLRLYQITKDETYLKQAEYVLKAAKNYILTFPPGACYHLITLQRYLDLSSPTISVALDDKDSMKNEIRDLLATHYAPHAAVSWKKNGKTSVIICRQDRCDPPLTKLEEIVQAVEKL